MPGEFSPTNRVFTPDDLQSYVDAAGENGAFDAKGPCSWSDDATKAALAKDIVAFANSAGGGAIVIGKSELADSTFAIDGLSPSQAASFNTTDVGTWVNSRFDPPVSLTCNPINVAGSLLVVIVVAEFQDTPSMCVREWSPTGGKAVLQQGAVYVRTSDAESKPLKKPSEFRALIDRAVLKRQAQIREIFDSALAGQLAPRVPTDAQKFAEQAKAIESDIIEDPTIRDVGAWRLVIHPDRFEEKWSTVPEMTRAIEKAKLSGTRSFPQEFPHPAPRDWGISGGFRGHWGLSHEGQFFYWACYFEDMQPWKGPYVDDDRMVPAREWLNSGESFARICESIAFASSYAHEFDPGQTLRVALSASHLKGRKLLGIGRLFDSISFEHPPTLANVFNFSIELPAGRLAASWVGPCQACLRKLVDRFPVGTQIFDRSLSDFIEYYGKQTGIGVL